MAVERKEKKRRRKNDADVVEDSAAGKDSLSDERLVELQVAERLVPAEEERKSKKSKKGKKEKIVSAAEISSADGGVEEVGEEALAVIPTEEKRKKKEKKSKQKAENSENVTAAGSNASQGGAAVEDFGAGDFGMGARVTASRDGDAEIQDADEKAEHIMNGTSAGEKGLSVREKKGKGKKGQKDRWGQKVVENTENPGASGGAAEAKTMSNGSSEDDYDPKKVFVGGMPYYITEDDIHNYFSECGVISEMDCMTFPDSGNFRGIAFITFATEAGATKSLEFDGSNMGGRFLKIERCKLKPRASAGNPDLGEVQKTPGLLSAYIGNLSWDIDEESIRKYLKKSYSASKIDAIRLSFDKNTGEFKGFGHIDFGDDASLEAAVKLNQTPLLGRPLKIAYAVALKQGNRNGAGNGNNRTEERRSGTCYNCGEEGHKSFVCPTKGASGNRKPDSVKVGACYSCGEHGHKAFACPKKE